MRRAGHYDVVVIGAGTAGLVAGIRLAQLGARVCVLAKGVGATHLAPGTIDVLGYGPQPVSDPAAGVGELIARDPGHPYGLIGLEVLQSALGWFVGLVADGPLPAYTYLGDLSRNFLLPTAIGALKPSALVPESFAAGDREGLGRVAVVGIPGLRDFQARLCASNLAAQGIDSSAVTLDERLERADTNPLGLARLLDDDRRRAAFAGRLVGLVGGADQVALPAVLGLRDPHGVLVDLERRLGRRVFEIPTLPPSVPGMRLDAILRDALARAGGRLVSGAGVAAHRREGDRILAVSTETAGSPTEYEADAFVLAAGGFHSGAITLDSRWRTRELVFGLPLACLPEPGSPGFVARYEDEQPMARAGVAVGSSLRARGVDNVVVAGASLPGAVPWREASGEGIALASGYLAASVLSGERTSAMERSV